MRIDSSQSRGRELVERFARVDAGIVDEDADRPEPFFRVGDQFRRRFRIGHIGVQGNSRPACGGN